VFNSKWQRFRRQLGLFLIPFVLTSCFTFGSRRAPVSGKERSREVVVRPESGKKAGNEQRRVPEMRGEVIANSLNIRAGANINYQVLGELSEGDKVSILSNAFGWHEIELPPECFGWVHSDYVSIQGAPEPGKRITGVVTGNSVRIRARPGLKYSVLLQINKSDKVVVIGSEGDWFKIELPKDCTGWVHSDYIRVLSR